jgi:CRP/FNR family cyclic AMP-dependent transcriptional regulator
MDYKKSALTFPARYDKELEKIIENNSETRVYSAKQKISIPGDPLNYIYYIKEGRTRHIITNLDGEEKILYTLSSGWIFGEACNDLNTSTGLYSVAEVKTVIYVVKEPDYHRLMDESKVFRDAILQSYANKIMILRYEIENLSFNSCKDRLKLLFCSAADPGRPIDGQWYNLKIHYTQYEIGMIVGGARVTVSKLITELYNENFMRLINHQMQINKDEYQKYLQNS